MRPIFKKVPCSHDHDPSDHHSEQSFSVLFVTWPQNGIRRRDWWPLQNTGLIVEPESDLKLEYQIISGGLGGKATTIFKHSCHFSPSGSNPAWGRLDGKNSNQKGIYRQSPVKSPDIKTL